MKTWAPSTLLACVGGGMSVTSQMWEGVSVTSYGMSSALVACIEELISRGRRRQFLLLLSRNRCILRGGS